MLHFYVTERFIPLFFYQLGKIPRALCYTPCGKYIVYPLGSFIVLKNLVSDKEAFLDGHNQDITCMAMSHDGEKIASGQTQFTGVKVSRESLLRVECWLCW
jgi:succinate dehydrogenase/fumarate reductase-like Fe-S protein